LRRVFDGADAVVHLAWAIQPRTDEPAMHRTNLRGSRAVLSAAADAGVGQVVCASSVGAYSPAERWLRITEDWPREGVRGSAYSWHKAALEDLLQTFREQHPGITLATIRPSAVVQYDAGADVARWALSPLLPAVVLGRRLLPIPIWPALRAQVVHADDVASALNLILDRHVAGEFNLAAEPVLTASAIARIFGGLPVPVPRTALAMAAWPTWRAGLQPLHPGWLTLADKVPLMATDRARSELGWEPRYDAATALAELVAGIRDGAGTASAPLAPAAEVDAASGRPGLRLGRPSYQGQV
jgi:nucleoside-diphosphate-sugar epimerase